MYMKRFVLLLTKVPVILHHFLRQCNQGIKISFNHDYLETFVQNMKKVDHADFKS
jgi:hypothetical protein